MAVLIRTKSGSEWYANGTIADVRQAFEMGQEVAVWWFAPWGQRYAETVWLAPDEIAHLRTESDDG